MSTETERDEVERRGRCLGCGEPEPCPHDCPAGTRWYRAPDPDDEEEGGERIVLPPLADGFQWVVTEDAIYSEETEPLRYPDHGPERTLFCHLRSTTEPEAEDG